MARDRIPERERDGTAEAEQPRRVGLAAGHGVVVTLPTYNERDNLEPIAAAILAALPEAILLVVDDNSPDGTGDVADRIAAAKIGANVESVPSISPTRPGWM